MMETVLTTFCVVGGPNYNPVIGQDYGWVYVNLY